jgi:diguanylate cyclase (GGDEF)-like protein
MVVAVTGKTRNLTLAIYWWCAAVLVVFAASSVLIVTMAGMIADTAHVEDEKALIRHDVHQQIILMARDQAQISHWDDTVRALGEQIDGAFVEREIADWLWDDFGIETTIVVSAENTPLVTVHQDEILHPSEGAGIIADTTDLVAAARRNYRQRRKKKGDGFMVPGNPLTGPNPVYVWDVRPVDGRMMFVVAQAIIPDRDAVLRDGAPLVLVTLKPATITMVSDLHETHDLNDFAIVERADVPDEVTSIPIGIEGDTHEVFAVWRMSSPSEIILARSITPLLGLLILAATALFLVARRSGAALNALQESEAQNRFLAQHDALTELPNRVQFDQALEHIITKGRQDRCAILCLDLDRFKAVNDTYGHHAGDVVIKVIAGRIAETVGAAGMAARIGGDEFIILLCDELDRESVLQRCDQIIRSVCRTVTFEGGVAEVGASIGVAWWPDDALTAKAVIRSADEALYRAKELGRGRTCLADELPEAGAVMDTDSGENQDRDRAA